MLNIYELEKKWIKYKIKSYTPYAIIFLALLLISFTIPFILNFYQETPSKKTDSDKIIIKEKDIKPISKYKKKLLPKLKIQKKEIEQKPKVLKKKIIYAKEVVNKKSEQKIVIQPSLNFIKDIQNDSMVKIEKNDEKKVIDNKAPKQIKVSKIKNPETKKNLPNKLSISINKQNTEYDINQVIKRFKKNNNPALSLFIAKKYFELGDYRKSYNYALITNNLNRDIEESWIIFAKSLVKLHKINLAVKVLQDYINYSNSNQAKLLLNRINIGKFK